MLPCHQGFCVYRKCRFNGASKSHSPWFHVYLFLTLFSISYNIIVSNCKARVQIVHTHTQTNHNEFNNNNFINVSLSLSPRWTRQVIYVKYLQEIIVNYKKDIVCFSPLILFSLQRFFLFSEIEGEREREIHTQQKSQQHWDCDPRYSENPSSF